MRALTLVALSNHLIRHALSRGPWTQPSEVLATGAVSPVIGAADTLTRQRRKQRPERQRSPPEATVAQVHTGR